MTDQTNDTSTRTSLLKKAVPLIAQILLRVILMITSNKLRTILSIVFLLSLIAVGVLFVGDVAFVEKYFSLLPK